MKGKGMKGVARAKSVPNNKGFYSGAVSSTAKAMKDKLNVGMVDGVMSPANAGRKPRKRGGGVMSDASKGTKRPGMC